MFLAKYLRTPCPERFAEENFEKRQKKTSISYPKAGRAEFAPLNLRPPRRGAGAARAGEAAAGGAGGAIAGRAG